MSTILTSDGKVNKVWSEQEEQEKEKELLSEESKRIQTRLAYYLEKYPYLSQYTVMIDNLNNTVEFRLKMHLSKDR